MGADIAVGSHPALRRADGLWRAARRLHGLQGCPQARHAGPHRRRHHRRARQQGLPSVAADPRAAYPPREGHVERLHRAGAAGGDGLFLRGVSRARGPEGHRAAGASQDRAGGHGAGRGRLQGRAERLLRHDHRRCRRHAGRDPARPPRTSASTCAASARRNWASASTRPRAAKPSNGCGAPSVSTARTTRTAATTASPTSCCASRNT